MYSQSISEHDHSVCAHAYVCYLLVSFHFVSFAVFSTRPSAATSVCFHQLVFSQ